MEHFVFWIGYWFESISILLYYSDYIIDEFQLTAFEHVNAAIGLVLSQTLMSYLCSFM